jgi:soluble lytic murein transglycosylase-like protein
LISIAQIRGTIETIAVGALLAAGVSAHAQVLEIGPTGTVTTYAGPTAFHADGTSTAIRVPAPARRRAGRPTGDDAHPDLRAAAAPGGAAAMATNAAIAAQISPALVEAVAWHESRFHARIISPAGAIGEMQLMPGTARTLGVDPYNSQQNYMGGARYLSSLMRRYDGDLVRTLAAYDAGPGAVDRYGGVPPYKETRAYVSAILESLSWRASLPAGADLPR